MARRLKLCRYGINREVEYQWLGAFRLRVEASDPSESGADPNVFLWQRGTRNPYNGTTDDFFIAVASAPDMSDYPVGAPDPNTPYPIFRLDYFEVDVRTLGLADEVWTTVVLEVNQLLAGLEILDQLTLSECVWAGGAPPEDGGAPSASSASDPTSASSASAPEVP
jgi:hypothetical protein